MRRQANPMTGGPREIMTGFRQDWGRTAKRIRVPMGFLAAVFYLWLARPSAASLLWSTALVGPGLLLRACASGYVKKNSELATAGPYAYTRNPLYLGSALLACGFALAAHSRRIALALAILFALLYWPTIRSEEAFLRSRFPEFDEYARRVPRLLPRLTAAPTGRTAGFSAALYWKHREYNAFLGACAVYAALLARLLLRA